MSVRVLTVSERPFTDAEWEEVVRPAWVEFLHHDAVVNEYWGWLDADFADFQFTLVDDEERVVGVGNTIPFAWDGTLAGLPNGINGVLPVAVRGLEGGTRATTLCALQAVVRPESRGQGLSGRIVEGMAELATSHGLDGLVAPVRPTLKDRYPLTPMASYVRWQRSDGLPFDPWLRVHARLGAETLCIAEGSMVITGTVAEWEEWTELVFPETGDYVVPGGLVPVRIDRERDEGRYVEPNPWMRHSIGGET
jgi:GNAT superfamily N-acetyltransferase